jgi:hypothetical protein
MHETAHVSVASLEVPTETDAGTSGSGMRALMLAVLENAIEHLGSPERLKQADAERWIMSPEHRYVFSFAVICETLNLDPSAARQSIIRLQGTEPPGSRLLRRTRSNVRHTSMLQLPAARRSAIVSRRAQTRSSLPRVPIARTLITNQSSLNLTLQITPQATT